MGQGQRHEVHGWHSPQNSPDTADFIKFFYRVDQAILRIQDERQSVPPFSSTWIPPKPSRMINTIFDDPGTNSPVNRLESMNSSYLKILYGVSIKNKIINIMKLRLII
jgi:hypothetical protein